MTIVAIFIRSSVTVFLTGALATSLASSVALAATTETAEQTATRLKSRVETLKSEVESAGQSLACRSASDCHALPMGRKPCGGPWRYMIASSRNPKFQALKKKLAEYDKADDAFNKATQQMSDCMMIEAPKVACEKKVCVKLP